MRSNSYTLTFISAVTVVLGFLLSLAAESLREKQEINVELDMKKNILTALAFEQNPSQPWTSLDIENLFKKSVRYNQIDKNGNLIKNSSETSKSESEQEGFTLYEKIINGKVEGYAIPISGKGLWSTLYGYLAIEPDGRSVKGITFYAHKETPGLGGEVEKPWFKNNFIGKQFADEEGNLTGIQVIKGKVSVDDPKKNHKVDGISGATMTCKGLNKFLKEDLEKYEPFFKQIRAGV
ncbi:MAG: NADH:ubiquinone reductase (Na(+)-transporting) subunit C [Candidatus Marinimicrobia bacterium]|jgi:Na+-transporting NADH:ubiquinone oxidoreductase subunit C|nr:NADH:ubiquinone reductase (Na(+)-transporting) subunit C [Candidatus Neomarinimicrobiota bacterium]|tara:strand:- start:327 stop:1034 length:708 start_codon:yes stop_codon:yes gene_type:complete